MSMPTSGGNVKITVVGDGVVGKTCLLIAYTKNEFPEEYVPTVFEHYGQNIVIDDVEYSMTLWDTAGQEDYERLRPLSYPNTTCFLVCFSVDSDLASYDNVVTKWVPEVRHYNPHTPIVLVGNFICTESVVTNKNLSKVVLSIPTCTSATKVDLRDDPTIRCYSTSDGKKLKRKVKAQGYVECSAKYMTGLEDVFVEAIRVYRKSKMKPRQTNCVIL